MYNARQKLRVKEKAGRSQMQLPMGKLSEYNYLEWDGSCDKTGEVSDMLWAHPKSISLFHSFPYVLIMDCTYKTNRYRLLLLEIVGVTSTDKTFSVAFAYLKFEKAGNYEWVLRRLAMIMKGCPMPNVIATYRELGLMKAIAAIYPSSRHMLCIWHISKNILANCKKLFEPKKWKSFDDELSILFKEESEESVLTLYLMSYRHGWIHIRIGLFQHGPTLIRILGTIHRTGIVTYFITLISIYFK